MTLEEARSALATATPKTREKWLKVVAMKEARVATEGGDGSGQVIRGTPGVPAGENPYDHAFMGLLDRE